jgi:uncharacterized membrane protein
LFALFDRLFGLPAHPLLVHVPIALVPVSAIALVVIAVSEPWRRRVGWWAVGLAFVSLFFVQLAMTSGESLQENVGERALVAQHADLAEPLRPLALAVLGLCAGVMVLDRRRRAGAPALPRAAHGTVVVLSVLAAAGSVVQLARVGHSGAKAVWHGTPSTARSAGDGDREGR